MKIIIPLLGHEEVRGSIASLLKSFRLLLHALFDLQDCLGFILKDKLVSFGRHNFTWFVPINNWLVHSIVNMGKEIENIFSKQTKSQQSQQICHILSTLSNLFLNRYGGGGLRLLN